MDGKYTFEDFNGNCGDGYEYETVEEALDAADYKWSHLTRRERRTYITHDQGAVFVVCDPEGRCVKDFTETDEE